MIFPEFYALYSKKFCEFSRTLFRVYKIVVFLLTGHKVHFIAPARKKIHFLTPQQKKNDVGGNLEGIWIGRLRLNWIENFV